MAAASNQTGATMALVFGAVMLLPGLLLVLRPKEAAHGNDSWGPSWLRNWNRSPGERSTPLGMLGLGFFLVVLGGVLLTLGILGLTGVIQES